MAKRYGARFAPSKWLRDRAARGEAFYPLDACATCAARQGDRTPCAASSLNPSTTNFAPRCGASFRTRLRRMPSDGASRAIVDRWAFTKAGEQGYLLMWADEKYGAAGDRRIFGYEQIVYEENMRYGEPGFYLQLHSGLVAPYIGKLGQRGAKGALVAGMRSRREDPGRRHDRTWLRQRSCRHEEHRRGLRRSLAAQWLEDLYLERAACRSHHRRGAHRCPAALWHRIVRRRSRTCRDSSAAARLHKMGLDAQDTSELFFDNVKVPKTQCPRRCGQGVWLFELNS